VKSAEGVGGGVEGFEVVGGDDDAASDGELLPGGFEGGLQRCAFDEDAARGAFYMVEAFWGTARDNVYIGDREAIAVRLNQICHFIVALYSSDLSFRAKQSGFDRDGACACANVPQMCVRLQPEDSDDQ